MNTKFLFSTLLISGALALSACGSKDPASTDDTTTTTTTSTSSGEEGSTSETSSGTSDTVTTTGVTTTTDGTTMGFVNNDSAMSCGDSCDIWNPADCADGQKCTAVACEVGSNAWDSNVCRDIQGSKALGDDCEYLGTGIDGNDDCDTGMLCWNQDADTGLGTCLAYCTGSPAAPSCDAGTSCAIFNDGVLPICVPSCDPLVQDCDNGDLCIPDADNTGFVCLLDASGGMAPYGTPCEFVNVCNTGLMCIAAEAVPEPDCATASGCCSPMCDINEANTCPGAGQLCESLYEPGMEPPGFDNIGVCAVPTG